MVRAFTQTDGRLALILVPLLAVVFGLVFISCITGDDDDATATPSDSAATLELTQGDNDGTFDVNVDEVITITLPANPSTGYEWAVAEINAGIVLYEGSDFKQSETDAVGSDGEEVLQFRAVRDGSTSIELKYWRSWEGDSSISDTFSVTINVN